jgi:hypothetical protein
VVDGRPKRRGCSAHGRFDQTEVTEGGKALKRLCWRLAAHPAIAAELQLKCLT